MSFVNTLKNFDAYPKLNDEFKIKTFGGAIISISAMIIIVLLFFSELSLYLQVERVDHLLVDVSRGEKLKINFDITFPHIPCSMMSLDAMDVSGSHQLDVSHHIKKKSLDKFGNPLGDEIKHELSTPLRPGQNGTSGNSSEVVLAKDKQPGYCGPCYGAELRPGQCCNTCDEVRVVYRARGWALPDLKSIEQCVASGETTDTLKEELAAGLGCQMYGYLEVNKVAGNFHFSPGKSFQHMNMHVHDLANFAPNAFNVSHKITSLSFGEPYPGMVNPLDNTEKTVEQSDQGGMYSYYVKVVPTTYSYLKGEVVNTNQFSVTEHFRFVNPREGQGLPGVFCFYDLSPIEVNFAETRKSLPHFLTQLCAILGGVFTVAGMIDKLIYGTFKQLEKGRQGKLG